MNETNQTTAPDPRELLAITLDLFGTTLGAITPEQFDNPSPCEGWTARDVAAHTLGVLRRITAIGQGEPQAGEVDLIDTADNHYPEAWAKYVAEQRSVWSDDALLGALATLPFGQMPGAVALNIYVSEVTVHTWDLATATGQTPEWNQEIVAGSLFGLKAALPGGERGLEMPFVDEIVVPDDAPLIDQLVAFCGRQPQG